MYILGKDTKSLYSNVGFDMYFYRPPGFQLIRLDGYDELDALVRSGPKQFLLLTDLVHTEPEQKLIVPQAELVYRSYPSWIENFNYFNWLQRSRHYSMYVVSRTAVDAIREITNLPRRIRGNISQTGELEHGDSRRFARRAVAVSISALDQLGADRRLPGGDVAFQPFGVGGHLERIRCRHVRLAIFCLRRGNAVVERRFIEPRRSHSRWRPPARIRSAAIPRNSAICCFAFRWLVFSAA